MKTFMLSAVVASALAMASPSVAADPYMVLSAGTYSVDDGVQTNGVGAGLGLTFAEAGAFSLSAEGAFSQAVDDTVGFEATVGALADVAEFGGVTVGLGGFGGVEWYNVSDFTFDNNDWVYGVQASFGNDDAVLRTRVYLMDLDNVEASVGVALNF